MRPPKPVTRRLLVAGFLLAALCAVLPIIFTIPAIIAGVVIINRGRTAPGVVVIVLSVVLPCVSVVVLTQVFELRPFRIPSEAMEPTIKGGDRVLTTKTSRPERGDIVVFAGPDGTLTGRCGVPTAPRQPCPQPTPGRVDQKFIKRVIAGPGERIKIIEGYAHVNGERLDEPYIRPDSACGDCNLPQEIIVPDDHWFVMGDNRGMSEDSRMWGLIPEDAIVGEVRLRYWPLGRLGTP